MHSRHRILELKRVLQKNLPSLCKDLGLNSHQEKNDELRFGNKRSLSISNAPGSVGHWKSFETDEGGDIVYLVSCYKNLDFVDTMRWVEDWISSNEFDLIGGQDDE